MRRISWLTFSALLLAPQTELHPPTRACAEEPLSIGSRRELFVDQALIGSLGGGARQVLHHPEPKEIALTHDAPWEGTGSGYHSVSYDPDRGRYRMYYKAWHLEVAQGKVNMGSHPLYCCYAESEDGIHWRKPELGLVEFNGSTANNIVLAPTTYGNVTSDPGHPAVFRDDNPACPPEARYKAVIRASKPHGLLRSDTGLACLRSDVSRYVSVRRDRRAARRYD